MPFLFPFFGLWALVSLAILGFTIWMLVDAARRPETDFNPPQSRVWWIVGLAVGIFLSWLGLVAAILYFVTVRKPVREGRVATPLFGGGSRASAIGPARTGRMCLNCGELLGTHAQYCQNCGTPVDREG